MGPALLLEETKMLLLLQRRSASKCHQNSWELLYFLERDIREPKNRAN